MADKVEDVCLSHIIIPVYAEYAGGHTETRQDYFTRTACEVTMILLVRSGWPLEERYQDNTKVDTQISKGIISWQGVL